eukprot:TRINITY_DN51821_c0_g1_i1.p2 TRINITY_DN51821_c0_g1~~TRINITY_DN51821_c0_g1_i1.p2  ORF type:complete len:140 (+),score=9.69 TRINITY_DN51821_c0_g1_i1:153-572(+)
MISLLYEPLLASIEDTHPFHSIMRHCIEEEQVERSPRPPTSSTEALPQQVFSDLLQKVVSWLFSTVKLSKEKREILTVLVDQETPLLAEVCALVAEAINDERDVQHAAVPLRAELSPACVSERKLHRIRMQAMLTVLTG